MYIYMYIYIYIHVYEYICLPSFPNINAVDCVKGRDVKDTAVSIISTPDNDDDDVNLQIIPIYGEKLFLTRNV
jgi:hypothetical protein